MRRNLSRTGLLLGACLILAPGSAFAERGVAMVLALKGSTTPAVAVHAELAEGSSLSLASGTTLTLVHYRSCEIVTVSGGKVTVLPEDLRAEGGTVQSRAKRPCPAEHRISGTAPQATAGALLFRSGGTMRLPARPVLVVAGERAAKLRAGDVRQDGKTVAALQVSHTDLSWPADKPALKSGASYTLNLTFSDDSKPLEIRFVADPPANDQSIVILRAD